MSATDLRGIHAAFTAAFNRGDVEALVALYEPGATLSPQPGVVVQGADAIRAALDAFVKTGLRMVMSTTYTMENGDLALMSGEWKLVAGDQVAMSGKTSEVLQRSEDGGWRYVIDNPFSA